MIVGDLPFIVWILRGWHVQLDIGVRNERLREIDSEG